jgi:hypothetical protein
MDFRKKGDKSRYAFVDRRCIGRKCLAPGSVLIWLIMLVFVWRADQLRAFVVVHERGPRNVRFCENVGIADRCQNDPGDPSNPVGPILRRQRCDPNGVWFIIAAWGISALLIFWACGRINGKLRGGWILLLIGISLDIAFGLSGMFGCLPWYWGRCEKECNGCNGTLISMTDHR